MVSNLHTTKLISNPNYLKQDSLHYFPIFHFQKRNQIRSMLLRFSQSTEKRKKKESRCPWKLKEPWQDYVCHCPQNLYGYVYKCVCAFFDCIPHLLLCILRELIVCQMGVARLFGGVCNPFFSHVPRYENSVLKWEWHVTFLLLGLHHVGFCGRGFWEGVGFQLKWPYETISIEFNVLNPNTEYIQRVSLHLCYG